MPQITAKLAAGDIEAAVALARQLADEPPASSEGMRTVGRHLIERGQYANALDLVLPYAEKFASDLQLRWLLAVAHGSVYQHGRAESHLRVVAESAKEFEPAQFALGRNLFKAGRNEEAIPYLRQALKLKPHHAATMKLLALALGTTDGYQEASELMKLVAEAEPADEDAKVLLGELEEIVRTKPPKEVFTRWPKSAKDFDDFDHVIETYLVGNYDTKGVVLRRGMGVFAQGSCFAGNLANSLRRYDLDVSLLPCGEDHNSTFANRAVVDWLRHGVSDERTEIVAENLGREKRDAYLAKLRNADLFVYTMGLAAVHFDRDTGEFVMSRATSFSRAALLRRALFRTSTVQQNVDNLLEIVAGIRELAPKAAIVLTVSPVPLQLTTEFDSAIVADCVSKSTLRVALHEVIDRNLPRVLYWPSFEAIRWLGGHVGRIFGNDDGSAHHVDFRIINRVMDAFMRRFADKNLLESKQTSAVLSANE